MQIGTKSPPMDKGMSDRGHLESSRNCERDVNPANGPEGRSGLERIRSLEQRRNMERRREQGLLERQKLPLSIGARVKSEMKKLLTRTTEDVSDDEDDRESEVDDGVRRENPGVGILWKMSFWATMSLFAYVFLNGPRIQANFVPDIVERDPISRITRPRNRRPRSGQ
ncbi:hypothetical protein Mapa_008343 [Marchantia paleacea]|nr:hypothetical protein Mapa_008343 [Marchantia paleacea]